MGGRVYFVSRINGEAPPETGFYRLAASVADVPLVTPGSGWVSSGLKPKVIAVPGEVVRYTKGTPAAPPAAPTSSSSIWPASPPRVLIDTVFRFRGFQTGMTGSPELVRTYRVRPGSMFLLVSGSVNLTADAETFRQYTLKEKLSGGLVKDVTSVWLKVSVGTRGIYMLRWADSTDHGAADAYTAAVRMSLFEEDTYASVYDRSGAEVTGRSGGYSGPVHVELAAGDYFLHVESTDGGSGGSFGISMIRE
jgi:hypothetical protein